MYSKRRKSAASLIVLDKLFLWAAVHVSIALFGPLTLLFSFCVYFLASFPFLGMQLNRKVKIRSENGAETELITSFT